MTCRHAHNDPTCGGYKGRVEDARRLIAEDDARNGRGVTPDAESYMILDVEAIGAHVILKVQYPSCAKCSYEGIKTLVFLDVALIEVVKWKRIDPHFREAGSKKGSRDAPSPAARFPASDAGWKDALAYAKSKLGMVKP